MLNAAISCNDEGNQELKVVYAKIRKRELFFIAVKIAGKFGTRNDAPIGGAIRLDVCCRGVACDAAHARWASWTV